MNTLFTNKIITQAVELGFDFEQFSGDADLKEIVDGMMDFFNENSEKLPQIEDECEVTSRGVSQNVSYGDYISSGSIVDFSENWHQSPDHKVFHSDFILIQEGVIKNMRLFYYVGETDSNAPDGYYFDSKKKCHLKIEEKEAE